MRILKSISILILILTYSMSYAQYTEVINSNRPGLSESAFSVGVNVIQFEVGAFTVKEEHVPLEYEVAGFGLGSQVAVAEGLPKARQPAEARQTLVKSSPDCESLPKARHKNWPGCPSSLKARQTANAR